MAMIGILILIGVVVNNGIVLIDHVNQLRLKGLSRDEASKTEVDAIFDSWDKDG